MGRATTTTTTSRTNKNSLTDPSRNGKSKCLKITYKWVPGSTVFTEDSKIRNMNLDVVKTCVNGVFIGFSTRSWAPDEPSYVFPMEKALNDSENGGALSKLWKHVFAFLPRRDTEVDDGITAMKIKKGSKWDWKVVVLVINEEDTASITKACRHVASCFTKFTRNKELMDSPEKYTFNKYYDADPQPLNRYLLDLDVAKVLKTLVCHKGSEYKTKEDVLENEDLLQAFFGSAEAGREYLLGMEDDDWDLLLGGVTVTDTD
ncbi:hypothetical protein ACHAWC_005527 [Mediolabrus comicus]|jgi:hypothetical protein